MSVFEDSPLQGFEWNQMILDGSDWDGQNTLLTIMAVNQTGGMNVIGTAFPLTVSGGVMVCASAAHVFEEIRRLQTPHRRHAPSTLSEFLPEPSEVNVDSRSVLVFCVQDGHPTLAAISNLLFDDQVDVAFFTIESQNSSNRLVDSLGFLVDGVAPEIGSLACVFSRKYEDINSEISKNGDSAFRVAYSDSLRIGRVLAYHPDGHRLCKGPCVETSIPVFSGMSGGPAIHYDYNAGGAMRVFGVVCSDPDPDTSQKMDRRFAGRSIIALIPAQLDGKKLTVLLNAPHSNTGGALKKALDSIQR